jgi:hypothetical protein
MKKYKSIAQCVFLGSVLGFLGITLYWGWLQHMHPTALAGSAGSAQSMATRPTIPSRPTVSPPAEQSPVPERQAPDSSSSAPVELCLRLSSTPSRTTVPGDIVSYQLTVHNVGRRDVDGVQIRFPYTPGIQEVLDASATNPSTWVSAVLTDEVQVSLGSVERSATRSATLRLRTHPTVPLGSQLMTQAQLDWEGRHHDNVNLSNRVRLMIADAPTNSPTTLLHITPASGTAATEFTVHYSGFASNERVSFWYQRSENDVTPLKDAFADEQGEMVLSIPASTFPDGEYTLVAYGQCSHITTAGVVTIAAN